MSEAEGVRPTLLKEGWFHNVVVDRFDDTEKRKRGEINGCFLYKVC